MPTSDRGPRLHKVPLVGRDIAVYAGVKVGRALEEITKEMTLFHGVKLAQVLEAVYEQGLKDGRGEVMKALDAVQNDKALKWRNPGRIAKKATKAVAKKSRRSAPRQTCATLGAPSPTLGCRPCTLGVRSPSST